jgi:hypothetical protein
MPTCTFSKAPNTKHQIIDARGIIQWHHKEIGYNFTAPAIICIHIVLNIKNEINDYMKRLSEKPFMRWIWNDTLRRKMARSVISFPATSCSGIIINLEINGLPYQVMIFFKTRF